MTDEDLVDLAQDGDRRAIALLASRYIPILDRYFRRRDVRPEDADDLVQRSLEMTIVKIDDFRSECSLKNYVMIVAGRIYYEHFRSRCRKELVIGPSVDDADIPDPAAGPDARLELDLSIMELQDAIQRLPDPFGEAVACHLLGMSSTEVGDAVGCVSNTARSRISRGLARLRLEMAPHHVV